MPEKDLLDISRLYVITRKKINASGTYTPAINSIALLWENPFKDKSLSFKFFALCIEKVLYHEIGHHKYRHKFGIDADQEKEADNYAFAIMQQNHPCLYFVMKILSVFGLRSARNYYRWGL